ncbi:methyl-accepting chemotaxis protein [Shewanella benthica KT99]|uniref:Methyl-accepting chemotaxis protein n=1 Tax=Shewanella benthica KT99 TaxID=314608 RepID=A9DAA9_9GAMM|nr:methyl-accepting chemotaxis protein [Shewanella benthica KT99]
MYPGQFSKPDKTVKIFGKATPALKHEREQLNATKSKVDRYSNLTGGNATIFVRDGDDFMRISTSLKMADGKRALGTYLGKDHPGYQALLKGENYEGYANLFGNDYMTVYRPFTDVQGRVIGILYIGFDITDSLTQLRQTIMQLKIEDGQRSQAADRRTATVGRDIRDPGITSTRSCQTQWRGGSVSDGADRSNSHCHRRNVDVNQRCGQPCQRRSVQEPTGRYSLT